MKNKKIIAVVIVSTLILLIGASTLIAFEYFSKTKSFSSTKTLSKSEKDLLAGPNIEEAISKYIGTELKASTEIKLNYVDNSSQNVISEYTFKNNGNIYEGVVSLNLIDNKWNVRDIDYMPIEPLSKPVTVRDMGGSFIQDNIERPYCTVSGVIKDKNIKQIILFYSDNHDEILNIGKDQSSFLAVRRGFDGGLKKIQAIGDNGNVIFTE